MKPECGLVNWFREELKTAQGETREAGSRDKREPREKKRLGTKKTMGVILTLR